MSYNKTLYVTNNNIKYLVLQNKIYLFHLFNNSLLEYIQIQR